MSLGPSYSLLDSALLMTIYFGMRSKSILHIFIKTLRNLWAGMICALQLGSDERQKNSPKTSSSGSVPKMWGFFPFRV